MPESVLRPAPVSATTRPPRRASGRSGTRVALLGPGPGLGGLLLAVLRRCVRGQALQQPPGGCLDLGNGLVERLLVGLGGLAGTADLADVLHGCGVHLVPRSWRLEVVQGSDVAAHGDESTPEVGTIGTRPSVAATARRR